MIIFDLIELELSQRNFTNLQKNQGYMTENSVN